MPHQRPWLDGIAGGDLAKLIESDAPVIRVIAGPGSGKTLAIERRIRCLIEGRNVAPGRIFVGAFNREIARQLSVSVAHAEADIEVSTLHSLAYRLLSENPVARQGRTLRILLSYETEPMLYDVGQALNDSRSQTARASQLRELEATYARRLDLEETAFQGEVDRWLRQHGAMLMDEFVPFANLEELRKAAQQVASIAGVEGLSGVVRSLRYRIATRMHLDDPTPPRVRITTLHAAKGLQSDRVVVAGLTDQIIPGPVSDPADREERRRLLYVAVTRARQELILSRSRRMRYADAQHNRVRIDDVRRLSGERWVMMGASSFIPQDFPAPTRNGPDWLRAYC